MSEWGWEIFQCLLFFAGAFAAVKGDQALERRVAMLEQFLLGHAIEKVRFIEPVDEEDGDDDGED